MGKQLTGLSASFLNEEALAAAPGQATSVRRANRGIHGGPLTIPITHIRANPYQPRTVFDEDALHELVTSIKKVGLLQPVTVLPADSDGVHELIAGERRLRAHQIAGIDVIPAIIRDTPESARRYEAIVENLHREDLNPIELAIAFRAYIKDEGLTQEDAAAEFGIARSTLTNALSLLALPDSVQRQLAAGVLTAKHGKALKTLTNPDTQIALADRAVKEGMSARTLEETILITLSNETDANNPTAGGNGTPGQPGVPGKPGQGRRKHRNHTNYTHIKDQLETTWETTVNITSNAKGAGHINIRFADNTDLQRLLHLFLTHPRAVTGTAADTGGDMDANGGVRGGERARERANPDQVLSTGSDLDTDGFTSADERDTQFLNDAHTANPDWVTPPATVTTATAS